MTTRPPGRFPGGLCITTALNRTSAGYPPVCLLVAYRPSNMRVYLGTDLLRQFTCCYTQIEVADQTFHLTQSQYIDTGSTSPSSDPITPGAWQGSQLLSHWYDSTPGSSALEADALTTRPTRRSTHETHQLNSLSLS